ncbi:SulP family inorganic anion transporter, partial [Porticoccus sp.]|uniref:SulP family inorganic anion transporter n=1 Tax=Porticoccus sp. TaxID=2024853 RepID=UPI003F69AF4F
MRKLLPSWLRDYQTKLLSSDLVAAVVVTLLLIPQGLAYAALAGLPPQLGLYASLLPLLAYALFGSSMVMSVGPVAVISLMTGAALAPIAEPGSGEYIAGAILLALMSGVMLFSFGLMRLGAMAQFLSHPVISGFISGAALLIIIGQLRPLLGISSHGETGVELAVGLVANLDHIQPLTAVFGFVTFFLLWLAGHWLAKLLINFGMTSDTASLIAKLMPIVTVLGSAALVSLMDWEMHLQVVGSLPGGLPALVVPAIDFSIMAQLWLPALAISLIGFVESVSIAQAFASKNRQRINTNAELRGLGAANIASALSGAFPVTGGFSRTAVNAEAGARS